MNKTISPNYEYLVIFNFETGDASSRWWQEYVTVITTWEKLVELEDSVASYLYIATSDDKEYYEMVADIMSARFGDELSGSNCNGQWKFVNGPVHCEGIYSIFV